jgi:hypothetical protein
MIDAYLDSLRALGIGVDALRGNHELMFFPEEGERNFLLRFPDASYTGYGRTVDSVAVILLNSNFDNLTPAQADAQQSWYARTLDSLDAEPSVRAVIVSCHHSPYSNSTIVGSSVRVQQRFIPLFVESRKSRVFLSGHAHGFEHFRRSGKDFLVIGGGGGLLHPLDDGTGRTAGDRAPSPRPRFHYILVRRKAAELDITIRVLQADVARVESVSCPLSNGEPPQGR